MQNNNRYNQNSGYNPNYNNYNGGYSNNGYNNNYNNSANYNGGYNNNYNRPNSPMNIYGVLQHKRLAYDRDATGRFISENGKIHNENLPLAEVMSTEYNRYEDLYVKLRAIAATPQNGGMVYFSEVQLSPNTVVQFIARLQGAGIVASYSLYNKGCGNDGVYVKMNTSATGFLNKGFAQMYVASRINDMYRPDEVYYGCRLQNDYPNMDGSYDKFAVDVMYRTGSDVHFVIIALSRNVTTAPNQYNRLINLVSRLKTAITIVVSPSVNIQSVVNLVRSNTRDAQFTVIPYNNLNLL
jgi:hypothetical protein